MQSSGRNSTIIITTQNKMTGVNYLLAWLAKQKGIEIVIPDNSTIKKFCLAHNIKHITLNLRSIKAILNLMKTKNNIIVSRTNDILFAIVISLIYKFKKVIKLEIRKNKTIFDNIVSVVKNTFIGWVDDDFLISSIPKKSNNDIVIISRLKPSRNIKKIIESLLDLNIKAKIKLRGAGELEKILNKIKDYRFNLITKKLPEEEYIELLDSVKFMVYPLHGTDLTCRTILEGMARGLVVINFEDLGKKYIIHGKNGFNFSTSANLSKKIPHIILDYKSTKKVSINAITTAKKLRASTILLPFL